MTSSWSDDELLARLAEAQRAADSVPREFIEAGKAAYAWRNIDAELAELAYDSALEEAGAASRVRAERAHLRSLTFTSRALTIEIEITAEALLGQVVPIQAGEVEIATPDGTASTVQIDDLGCFTIQPIPAGPFRLRCRTASGACVSTSWLTF